MDIDLQNSRALRRILFLDILPALKRRRFQSYSTYAATLKVAVADGITTPFAWQASWACPALLMFIAAFTSALV